MEAQTYCPSTEEAEIAGSCLDCIVRSCLKMKSKGCGYVSVVEHFPSMCDTVLSFIPRTKKEKKGRMCLAHSRYF